MVDISDIGDRDSLRAWLNERPEALRQKEAVTIAHRAAMRVLPIYSEAASHKADLTEIPILRANLISGVAGKMPTPEIKRAAYAAAQAA